MKAAEAFKLLGVTPETPLKEIRSRYHALIRQVHPDGGSGDDGQAVQLIEAYNCIRSSADRSCLPTAKQIFALGQEAVHGGSAQLRLVAVRQLARSRMQSAVVFLRQALFDHDVAVATAAAQGMVLCGGIRGEEILLSVFDRVSVDQRLAVLGTLQSRGISMPRLVRYALADPSAAVRTAAQANFSSEVSPHE